MIRYFATALILIACMRQSFGGVSSSVTLDSIVKTLQAREKALTSFEIHGRSIVTDDKGERVANSVQREFSYTQTSKGERELREILISPDGVRTVANWIRDDGSKLYTMQCTPKSENVIESVVIEETPNQPSRCVNPVIPYTNILSPRGKRLADLVATGKSIDIVKDKNGDEVVEVRVSDGEFQFGLQLSGKHDYLPREVRIVERDRKVVSSFRNVNGFWFPESGYSDQMNSTGGNIRLAFQIDRIVVNPAKTSKDFGMPKLDVGTVIHNRTKTGPRGVFGVPVGDSAKERKAVEELRGKYGSNSEPSEGEKTSTKLDIAAMVEPEQGNLARVVLVIGASFALCVVVFLKLRR